MNKYIELKGTKEEALKYCKLGESVPCQVREHSLSEWHRYDLFNIINDSDHPFVTGAFSWKYCRIPIPEKPKDKWLRAVWVRLHTVDFFITRVCSEGTDFIYFNTQWWTLSRLMDTSVIPLDANKEEIK